MNAPPPCAGLWELFDSTEPADHDRARALCMTCPMRAACDALRQDAQRKAYYTYGPAGTWAGKLLGPGPAKCGTNSGYYRHLRTPGDAACESCKLAHNTAERERRARSTERTLVA